MRSKTSSRKSQRYRMLREQFIAFEEKQRKARFFEKSIAFTTGVGAARHVHADAHHAQGGLCQRAQGVLRGLRGAFGSCPTVHQFTRVSSQLSSCALNVAFRSLESAWLGKVDWFVSQAKRSWPSPCYLSWRWSHMEPRMSTSRSCCLETSCSRPRSDCMRSSSRRQRRKRLNEEVVSYFHQG